MIRVLIAEDSPTALQLLSEIITTDRELIVVGTARDGAAAVAMTRRLRPDVVVMDIHMPVMDGFEATRRIMVEMPTPIVIVSGSVNVAEVAVSMQALRLGALSLLEKPKGPSNPDFHESSARFAATVKAMAQVKVVRHYTTSNSPPPLPLVPKARSRGAPRIIAIGASTGGPAALYRILGELPRTLPVPILIAQHIALGFVDGLASWLDSASPLRIKVADHGENLAPATVYLAPDGCHLGLASRDTVSLFTEPAVGGFRPSATFLFESVARWYGPSTLALILTGMGQDGLAGLRAVRAAGGTIIAQNEESSVVFGMPGVAIAEGLADVVSSLDIMASRVRDEVLSDRWEGSKP